MTQTLDRPQTVEDPIRVSSPEEDAVLRGVAWIDKWSPFTDGWEYRIDLDILDLTSNTDCILGQLYGNAAIVFYLYHMGLSEAQHLGFAGWPSRYDGTIACWRKVIKERRGEL